MSTELISEQARTPSGEWRHVLAMSLPVVITTSSRAMMDVVDYFMISQLGQDAIQAAMLPGQMIMWGYLVFGLGIVSMVNTFASQALGGGRRQDCSAYTWQAVYVAGVVGLVGLCFRSELGWLIALIGHEPAVQVQELAYSRVALLTVFPTLAAAAFGWFFIGIHRPWVTTWSVIEANIVNVIVSYVLIFGAFGVESMGIAGAAWGTLVGVCYRTVRLGLTMLRQPYHDEYATRTTWRFSGDRLKRLLQRGIPAGIQWVSEVGVWAIFITVMVGRQFGTNDLLATNVAWQYMRIAFLPTIGVAQALTAMVGKSIGSGEPDRAVRQTRLAVMMTFAYMGSLSLIYLVFRTELISVFNTNPEVVAIGERIIICAAVFQLFDALGITHDGALRGAGDTFVPAVFYVISTWFALIGLAWWISTTFPSLGSLGPWIAATLLISCTAIFLTWRWHSGAWRKIDLLGRSAGAKKNNAPDAAAAEVPGASSRKDASPVATDAS